METIKQDVVIVGGGPAGMVLGLLLSRLNYHVMVIEKNENFDRDYRGEVLQPRFMELMQKVNLHQTILELPHTKIRSGHFYHNHKEIGRFPFNDLSHDFPFGMWMPQPILLDGLHQKCRLNPHFKLLFGAHVKRFIYSDQQVTGIVIEDKEKKETIIEAPLTVGADGRFSTVKRLGKFEHEYEYYPGDILWFTMPCPPDWKGKFQFHLDKPYPYLILPKHPDAVQVGLALPLGKLKQIKQMAFPTFKDHLKELNPHFREFAATVPDFSSFVPLQAKTHYMKQWYKNGCLLIGDAAHCSSPAGAIGVSLAVTSAVIAAEVIHHTFQSTSLRLDQLHDVQARCGEEIKRIHQIQNRLGNALFSTSPFFQTIRPFVLSALTRTSLISVLLRKVVTLPASFEVDSKLSR
ncbi:FAD-dependent monooxygenase [Hazenella sp. IB182353]|uniref:FAD-dependent monooxygenase n=1 Tax=Polycladospora coralii TaxID=2771432 RepID=UPI0017475620|nr:FAD-dependent monooxygenase [Polycladospora coralii]MBS7530747.1 FAD-dependent monooxygenase [Polycladospora coralii]